MVERELGVDPHDFRRWVCLHEETHRTQFTAVPWLRGYVQEQMTEFLLASDLDPATILERLRSAADAVAGAVRDGGGDSVIEAIQSPRQRDILDRLTSVMTLVEGHGDYVMDAVGPQVVPSVAQIRAKFNERRGTGGAAGAHAAPDPRHRPQDEAVRAGLALRADRRGRGGHGHLQQGVDVAGDAADQGRVRHPAALARPGGPRTARWPRAADRTMRPASRGRPGPGRVRAAASADLDPGDLVLAACSGGADSLALAAALAHEAPRLGLRGGAVTVDHGLQDGSAARAAQVGGAARPSGSTRCGGPGDRAAAGPRRPGGGRARAPGTPRWSRWREQTGAAAVLLGHTRDDQAETVLLGLARGSGAAGAGRDARPARPVPRGRCSAWPRATLREACLALRLEPWDDPHNSTRPTPAPGSGTRRCPCWRRRSARASPRRWPAAPPS